MAVSVLSEAQLTQREVHTVADLAGLTPGLTVSQNTGFSQLTIRGIGSTAAFAGSDPSSAVYIDGVYIARPAAVLTEFLDLDRVEVLRGPQGTLYGHNAVGGALNLTTKVPTDDVAFSTRLVVGDFQTFACRGQRERPVAPRPNHGRRVGCSSGERRVCPGSHPPRPPAGHDRRRGGSSDGARAVQPPQRAARQGRLHAWASNASVLCESARCEARVHD